MKAKSHRQSKRTHARAILRLPDLDIAKAAVDSHAGPCAAALSSRNRRMCGLVLLRAAVIVQQNRGSPISNAAQSLEHAGDISGSLSGR